MKKQTMYNRLQKHYNKLNQRIQKGMQTGRFYNYTQFKQEQLLNRLNRFSLQLKQLGAGVAVVAALGMATPTVGQTLNFDFKTGSANPFDGFIGSGTALLGNEFVDLDGDGDQDLFLFSDQSGNIRTAYYENVGTVTAPSFLLQTGTSNPLDTFIDKNNFSFVDLDGDGDMDLFTSRDPSNYPTDEFNYYENTGTSTSPIFTLQSSTNNPLDSVLTHLADLNLGVDEHFGFYPSFVDIDGDGDQDCFMGIASYDYANGGTSISDNDKLWYYENTGTVTAPIFQRQNLANNPAASLFSTSIPANNILAKTQFVDFDQDGDHDMITNFELNYGSRDNTPRYFRNEGTSTNPNLVSLPVAGTPLDTLNQYNGASSYYGFIDLDNDGDVDATSTTSSRRLFYFENVDSFTSLVTILNVTESIIVYPNPTTGLISLDKIRTGQLQIFNTVGQEVYAKELEEEQNLDLSNLEAGTYLLRIKEDKKYIQQTIIIHK